MNLTAWLDYLETLHPKAIDLGLERVRQVAVKLDLLPFPQFVITVGGTNGKGSCVALLESILLAQGYTAGAYTSPHLLQYNERIRINAQSVTDETLCNAFDLIERARGNTSLTYFEYGTLAALLLFKQADLDVVILEVGMGGRLDAVNIIDANIALISTIALDHTEWLGTDREAIGYEKAGIMRTHKPVVSGDFATPASIRDYAQSIAAPLYCPTESFTYQANTATWDWFSKQQTLSNLPLPAIELQNAATVLQAIELLPDILHVTRDAIIAGLQQVNLPGRFQIFTKDTRSLTILDVAHNPAGGAWLAKRLSQTPCSGQTYAVAGMLSDKDRLGTVKPLLEQIDAWHIAGLPVPRGDQADIFAEELRFAEVSSIQVYSNILEAYAGALAKTNPADRIIVFGSFYTVAEVLRELMNGVY